jgi:hypothetical protein
MLTATHQHALLKTKGQKLAKLERKYYSKFVLKFYIRALHNVLIIDILILLNILKVSTSTSSTLSEVRISNLSICVKRSRYIKSEYVFRVIR